MELHARSRRSCPLRRRSARTSPRHDELPPVHLGGLPGRGPLHLPARGPRLRAGPVGRGWRATSGARSARRSDGSRSATTADVDRFHQVWAKTFERQGAAAPDRAPAGADRRGVRAAGRPYDACSPAMRPSGCTPWPTLVGDRRDHLLPDGRRRSATAYQRGGQPAHVGGDPSRACRLTGFRLRRVYAPARRALLPRVRRPPNAVPARQSSDACRRCGVGSTRRCEAVGPPMRGMAFVVLAPVKWLVGG